MQKLERLEGSRAKRHGLDDGHKNWKGQGPKRYKQDLSGNTFELARTAG